MNVYLDNASTTNIFTLNKDYIITILDMYGNPSSSHQLGEKAKKIVEFSRKNISKFINSSMDNIIFTCSGSASNTLAIKGFTQKNTCNLLYSPTLHKSALKCIDSLKVKKKILKINSFGEIDLDDFKHQIKSSKEKPFVIIEYANSEIGTIQDVIKIITITHDCDGVVYLDCTGSISQIPVNVKELDIDMLGFSAHKLGALKGCGVLYKKSNIELEPLIYGSQEKSLFAGTENVLGIASLGKAIENYDYSSVSSANRDYVYDYIVKNISDSYLIGTPFEHRLPHNLYMCFKGVQGESLMILLDMNGIQVSTGSACTSEDLQPSSTLTAIGIDKEDINSCIRMTFNGNETKEELDYVCTKLKECVERLRSFSK